MKSILNACLLLVATLLFASCAPTLNVVTDYNHSADFTKFKTFSMYQMADKSSTVSQLNQNRIFGAVKAQMVQDGFTEVASNPDLLVNVTAVRTDQKGLESNTMGTGVGMYGYGGFYRPYGFGGMYGGGMSSTTVSVTNTITGSVIIDIIDASNNQVVWTGTGNKEIDKPAENPDQAISAAIAKIMYSFPPGVVKPKAK
jgi:hypothetical protein